MKRSRASSSRATATTATSRAATSISRAASSTSKASTSASKAASTTDVNWLASGHEWLGTQVRRVFHGESVNGKIVKWARAEGSDAALWHVRHDDGDEEDLDEAEAREAMMCFEMHGYDGPIAGRPRPRRKSAVTAATRSAANIKEYDEQILSSADEDDEDGAPAPARRRGRGRASGQRQRAQPLDDDSEDDYDDKDHDDGGSDDGSGSGSDDGGGGGSGDESGDESGSDGEWGASSSEEEAGPSRPRQSEGLPPADTSPEAAADAAVASRRDLRDVSEEVWEEVLRAATEAHSEGVMNRSRGSRSGAAGGQSREQIAAYYKAEDAAKAVLTRAYPRAKPKKRAAAARADDAEPSADIEKERKRNIERNHEVLASLGLA